MRVAVVGSGISGLAAARRLGATQRVESIELFEADSRPGGHVNTIDVDGVPVDTGFIIYNERTYPRLTRLFRELDVPTRPTEMSFSSTCERCGHSWGTATWRSSLDAGVVTLVQIVRFFRAMRARLARGDLGRATLGDVLDGHDAAARHFIVPMGAAIWSTSHEEMLDFPAEAFLSFWRNHGMLQTSGAPIWRTVVGGSRVYVDRLLARLPARLHLSTPVTALRRDAGGVVVNDRRFDAAILAVHSDVAHRLTGNPLLADIPYTPNDTWLHTDDSFMPPARRAWSSWNVRTADCRAAEPRVEATYWMNRLQGLAGPRQYFVTLNPTRPIAPSKRIARIAYAHPLFSFRALDARARLVDTPPVWLAGAWRGHGFHEDGLRSGEEAAEALLAWSERRLRSVA